ncbi:MAG: RdgB/HAM1 family non-canonical purine NTP pyrophosphatase [Caulobacterales bacterium]
MSAAKALFAAGKLVVASHNAGKVVEIGDLLAPFKLSAISAGALGLPEPEETETTFIGNALLKARAAAQASGLPALADDSGLEVRALNGDPGVFSARWAGPGRDFGLAMRKVEDALQERGAADRAARFVCVLAVALPDGSEETFEGESLGEIVWPPRGGNGFGYDPIFRPLGYSLTFAEMAPAYKHTISHRAEAFAKLVTALNAS